MTQPWLHTCFCLNPREFKHLLPKMWWEMLWELWNNGAFFLPFVITTRQVSGSESALDSFWGKHPERSGQSISSAFHKAETANGLGWLLQRRICNGVGGIPVGCCHWPEHEFECLSEARSRLIGCIFPSLSYLEYNTQHPNHANPLFPKDWEGTKMNPKCSKMNPKISTYVS